MPDTGSEAIERFAAFVAAAKVIRPPAPLSVDQSPVGAFRLFVSRAMPLAVADIRARLPTLAERAKSAARWLVRDDLFAIGGYRYAENAYTELMAWALHPNTHPASARARQAAWLESLGLSDLMGGCDAAEPETQVRTNDGVPDLVMRFGPHVLCVEAKTASAEHPAPASGKAQTVAYPDAIRDTLRLSPEARVPVVFITLDGRPAANVEAVSATYAQFALAVVGGLEPFDVPRPIWATYAVLFTHLLGLSAAPGTDDLPALVNQVIDWSGQSGWDDAGQIYKRQAQLVSAIAMLIPERVT